MIFLFPRWDMLVSWRVRHVDWSVEPSQVWNSSILELLGVDVWDRGLIRFDKLASSYAMLQCILASCRKFIFLSIKHQVNVIHTFSSRHAEWKGIFFFMILHTLVDSIRSGCAWLERNTHEKIKKCRPWKGDSCRKSLSGLSKFKALS